MNMTDRPKAMAGFKRRIFRKTWFLIPALLVMLFSTGVATSAFAASGVVAIAAGGDHAVALKSDGSVVAWGNNNYEQTTVPTLASTGVTAIAAGDAHTVALKSDGSVVAWGNNDFGQSTVPPEASSGVIAIAAGFFHTVALKSDGSVVAWGNNDFGQTAVPASASSGVVAIAAGYRHTVVLKSDGSVVAWGWNDFGQCTVPESASTGVIAIAAGYAYGHTVALKSDGSVLAWGENNFGQIDVPASASTGVTAIATGGYQTLAVKSDGSVVVWGSNNFGESIVPPEASSGVIAVSGGYWYTMALKSDGSVVAWGDSQYGKTTVPEFESSGVIAIDAGGYHTLAQKSDGSVVAWGSQTTVPESASSGVIAISGGDDHSVALKSDGSVVAWGGNWNGQSTVPESASSGVIAIAAGHRSTAALKSDGSVVAWGGNWSGQSTVPEAASSGVIAIAAGGAFTVALKNDGSVVAWGRNEEGQATVPEAATSGVIAIAAGFSHTVALKSDGSVVAWGDNYHGQTTVPESASSGVIAIAAGHTFTAALKSDGSVVAWGNIYYGVTEVPESASSGVIAIAAGLYHIVALKSDGSVVVWGDNYFSQVTGGYPNITINPSGTTSSQTINISGNAGGLNCQWDGSTTSGTCSADIFISTKVVLTASPADMIASISWGAGCDSVTATTCTIDSLAAATTISPVINAKIQAAITLGNLNQTYDGTPKAVTATTNPAGLAVTFTYDGSATVPTNAGNYTVVATINDPNYLGTASDNLTIAQAAATITLENLSQTYDGTPKTATAMTSPAGLVVDITYNGSSTAPTTAGDYAVVATINDPNYQGSASGTLNIAKAAATITLGNLSQIYDGKPKPVQTPTAPIGLTVVTTYNGSAIPPKAVGSYAIVSTINDPNYQGSASGTLIVSKMPATITLGNLSHTYDGTPKAVTATTTPAGLTVNLTYNGSATPPTTAGDYVVEASISDPNYQGTATGTLSVAKAAATITLGDLTQTYDGTPKAVSAMTNPAGLAVAFTYDGSATVPTNIGIYTVAATISDPNYQGNAGSILVIANANPQPATITLGNLTQTYDGTPKAAAATTDPAGLAVTFTYDGSDTVPTNAGSYAVAATIRDPNYQGTASGTLNVAKANQTISFTLPATAKFRNSVPLTATASLPVTYVVTSGPGVIVGTDLTFTGMGFVVVTASQSGDSNYNAAADVQVTIEAVPHL